MSRKKNHYVNANKYVISLKTAEERTRHFFKSNAHAPDINFFPARDGRNINVEKLSDDIIKPNTKWRRGSIGCGISHSCLWLDTVERGNISFIFEDDAYLCRNFVHESDRILSDLPEDWDICLWGHNPNTFFCFDALPGFVQYDARFDKSHFAKHVSLFTTQSIQSKTFPLVTAMGTCGYALSPKGAQKLLNTILPFRNMEVYLPFSGRKIMTDGIDGMMCGFYKSMNAYICIPPLCLVEDDLSNSATKKIK